MPSTCVVPHCFDRSGGHKFPRDKILRQKWVAAIRRDNFQPSEYSKVCKKHFRKEDYKLPKDSTLKYPLQVLKKDAIPSKFSWNEKTHKDHKDNTENKIFLRQRCSVLQCKTRSSKNIILHSCPKQEDVQKKWAEVLKIDKDVVQNMKICSHHFLKTDFLNSKKGETLVLNQNGVPSQKLPKSTKMVRVRKKGKNEVLEPKSAKKKLRENLGK